MARGKRDLELEARWRELVARQATSGLSVRAFCVRERVRESGFYMWRRELRLRDQEQMGVGKAAKGHGKVGVVKVPSFVPVSVSPVVASQVGGGLSSSLESIVVELRSGQVLRFPPQMALERVVELVYAIEGLGGGLGSEVGVGA